MNAYVVRCLLMLSLVAAIGCDLSNQIKGSINAPFEDDFLKTEIIANGPIPADGATPLVLAIQLKNSNNHPVKNYKPLYDVTASAGIVAGDCTTSDVHGVSVCIVKSTVAGTKTVTLTNAKIGLTKNIDFVQSIAQQKAELVPGAVVKGTTPQGSKVQVSVGRYLKGASFTTADGSKVKFSLQGVPQ